MIVQTSVLVFKFKKEISPKKIFFAYVLSGGKKKKKYKTIIIKYDRNKKIIINELTCTQVENLFSWLKLNFKDCRYISFSSKQNFYS